MTLPEHQALIDVLHRRRTEIVQTMAALEASGRPVELDQTTQGRLSRMDAISQQQMARAGRVNLANELTRIDAALKRAERGTFGQCCRCAMTIETDRLRADSAVPFCIACLEEVLNERRRQGFDIRTL